MTTLENRGKTGKLQSLLLFRRELFLSGNSDRLQICNLNTRYLNQIYRNKFRGPLRKNGGRKNFQNLRNPCVLPATAKPEFRDRNGYFYSFFILLRVLQISEESTLTACNGISPQERSEVTRELFRSGNSDRFQIFNLNTSNLNQSYRNKFRC